MEYERIHKVQTGIISPSKLRMKLMGPHHNRKKEGSNSNSARTSPSKLEDHEFVKNSLLASNSGDFSEEVAASSLDVTSVNVRDEVVPEQCNGGGHKSCQQKETLSGEINDLGCVKMHQLSKGETGNSSAVHPLRLLEDENLDYDSNASSSSFEFHNERAAHNQFARSFSRPVPSKWNDAEKWIMKRQNAQPNHSKKNASYNQANHRMQMSNTVRVAPESSTYDAKSNVVGRVIDTKLVDTCQPTSKMGFEKFSFITSGNNFVGGQPHRESSLVDQCTQSKDLEEVEQRELYCTKSLGKDSPVVPVIRSVCMRDMGTEMTPATSLEPSRTATPVGATTPLRSPTSSIPSTPRRGAPTTPVESDDNMKCNTENSRLELTEQEMKLKTRREIVALGVQLGKMSIAAWASKDDQNKNISCAEATNIEELDRIEFEKRAAAWEEAEKSRHAARYRREEIKIHAWESQQKAKLEAEMRRIESQVEQMRAQAHEKMVKKIAMTRQKSEEKRAAAEVRKNRDAERTAAQVEYIRQTGRMPSSHYMCCGWLS